MKAWKEWKRWRAGSGRTSGKSRIYEGRRREKTEIRIEVVGIDPRYPLLDSSIHPQWGGLWPRTFRCIIQFGETDFTGQLSRTHPLAEVWAKATVPTQNQLIF